MLELTNIHPHDTDLSGRAAAFLEANRGVGLRPRPAELLDRALQTGLALVVRDGTDLFGLSLVYSYAAASGSMALYHELGTMLVTLNGLGIQAFLTRFHLIQAHFEADEDVTEAVFAVVAPGSASAHVLTARAGLLPEAPPPELVRLRERAGVPFAPGKTVLFAPPDATRQAFRALTEAHVAGREFRLPKGGRHIVIGSGWFDPARLADVPRIGPGEERVA